MVFEVVVRLNETGNKAFTEEVKRVKSKGQGTVFDSNKILKKEFV